MSNLDKYWEFLCEVLDKCDECDGLPVMKSHRIPKGIVVECDTCGQLVGPCESKGMAMVQWNKQQRGFSDGSNGKNEGNAGTD